MFIADLHIGVMQYAQTYLDLMYLKDKIKAYTKNELLDFIIIGGDYFDKQLYINSPFSSLALKFMIHLLSSAKKVRIITGTSSHDCDQYSIFKPLIEDLSFESAGFQYDFEIINTVREEDLFPDLHVLYIPEEYIFNQGEYYKDYLTTKEKYDYIFGHGIIKEGVNFHADQKKDISIRRKAAVFSTAELEFATKGKIYFGHYHMYTNIHDKVFYVGSTFRWKFNEEEDKGFFLLFSDTDEGFYREEFIVNPIAKTYITVTYRPNDPIYDSLSNLESSMSSIIKQRMSFGIDFLRIIFFIPDDYQKTDSLISYVKERFMGMDGIKLEFNRSESTNTGTDAKNNGLVTEEEKILLDKNIAEETKLSFFLKNKCNITMSEERIKKYLEREVM